jgi:hypothetical protein
LKKWAVLDHALAHPWHGARNTNTDYPMPFRFIEHQLRRLASTCRNAQPLVSHVSLIGYADDSCACLALGPVDCVDAETTQITRTAAMINDSLLMARLLAF